MYNNSIRVNSSAFIRMARTSMWFIRLTCNLDDSFEMLYYSRLWCWKIFYFFFRFSCYREQHFQLTSKLQQLSIPQRQLSIPQRQLSIPQWQLSTLELVGDGGSGYQFRNLMPILCSYFKWTLLYLLDAMRYNTIWCYVTKIWHSQIFIMLGCIVSHWVNLISFI